MNKTMFICNVVITVKIIAIDVYRDGDIKRIRCGA